MKTKFAVIFSLFLLIFGNITNQKTLASRISKPGDSILVKCSPDLFNLTSAWVKEYNSENPTVTIQVDKLPDSYLPNPNSMGGKIYFISSEYNTPNNESLWKMVIGMDATVAIVNSKNPYLSIINQLGVSPEKIAQFILKPELQDWSTLLQKEQKAPINFYMIENEHIKSEVAGFLKLDRKMIGGIKIKTEKEMISAIQKDPYSIGFCKVSTILDPLNQDIIQGIKLLSIDKNNNGKIDYSEKIYDDLDAFLRGVWIGKYPKELCSNIYSISSKKPSNENEIAFLAWVTTNGQQYLNPNGFSDLANNQRQTNFNNLYNKEIVVKSTNNRSALPIAILILVACAVLVFAVDSTLQRIKFKKNIATNPLQKTTSLFNENSIVVPNGLYFDKSHTWAFMEKEGVVGIGIDDFLQHVTGPITRIIMKGPGEMIKKGEPFLKIIQDGKQLNLKAPISGRIKAQNKNLLSNSSLINQSPYGEGWVYIIEPTNWLRDTQFLIFANGYKEWLKMEFLHLKDFLAVATRANNLEVVFQDGGEIKDGILKDLKPQLWEDFQTHFLDSSI